MGLTSQTTSQLRKRPRLLNLLKRVVHQASPETVALLDYPVYARRRWDEERPHAGLLDIIAAGRKQYDATLYEFLQFAEALAAIPRDQVDRASSIEPAWENGWMPALDGVALYCFLATLRPRLYMEVGSGNSTMFARRAIRDQGLGTKIVSIDPQPRAEVNALCDEIIRQPVEDIDLGIFDRLEANDILYIDNSHRALMNSDATTLFLDVLPRLKPGVVVEIHDITLPYDYPQEWVDRHYSEQYVLAAFLLARGSLFDVILPSMFISCDGDLQQTLAPLWKRDSMQGVQTHGCSFWIKMR